MRVCIVCLWDRYATPYLQKYEQMLSSFGVTYDVLLWERGEQLGKNYKTTDHVLHIPVGNGAAGKLLGFLKWRKQVNKILKKTNYDRVIVLTTVAGVLLASTLRKKYSGKYIFDIRDFSYEHIKSFLKIEKKVISDSFLTTISSDGYRSFLPEHPYVLNHNITHFEQPGAKAKDLKTKENIDFAFVGNIRLFQDTFSLLKNMGKCKRYTQSFIGREIAGCDLDAIAKEHGIINIRKQGVFTHDEKPKIYEELDLVNSVYGDKRKVCEISVNTALSNKIYDAAVFRRPIVASKGTYLAEVVEEYGLGFAVDGSDENAVQAFERYLDSYDMEVFTQNCERFVLAVKRDEDTFREKVKLFVKE